MTRAFLLILALLVGLLPGCARATPAHVQSCQADPGGTNPSVTCTFGSSISANDAVLCYVTNDSSGSATVSTIEDGNSHSFTIEDSVNDAADTQLSTDAYIIGDPGGTTTVTATYSTSAGSNGIACDEYSGIATSSALDNHTMQLQATPGTGSNGVTSGSATTTSNGDIVWGGTTLSNSGAGATISAGSGFTDRNNISSFMSTEDEVQASAGSVAATFTISVASPTVTGFIALKASAATVPHLLPLLGVGQ